MATKTNGRGDYLLIATCVEPHYDSSEAVGRGVISRTKVARQMGIVLAVTVGQLEWGTLNVNWESSKGSEDSAAAGVVIASIEQLFCTFIGALRIPGEKTHGCTKLCLRRSSYK